MICCVPADTCQVAVPVVVLAPCPGFVCTQRLHLMPPSPASGQLSPLLTHSPAPLPSPPLPSPQPRPCSTSWTKGQRWKRSMPCATSAPHWASAWGPVSGVGRLPCSLGRVPSTAGAGAVQALCGHKLGSGREGHAGCLHGTLCTRCVPWTLHCVGCLHCSPAHALCVVPHFCAWQWGGRLRACAPSCCSWGPPTRREAR